MSPRGAAAWVAFFAALVLLALRTIDDGSGGGESSGPEQQDGSEQSSNEGPRRSAETLKPRTVEVVRAVDGDTIVVRTASGGTERVRYIGGLSRVSTATDEVERVSDGDTVVLKGVGKTRLIGVDTPEVFNTPECFGKQASAFTKKLLPPGSKVRVWWDREPQDRYGRMLLYLQLPNGRLVNDLLVRNGMAVTLRIEPNSGRADHLRSLSRQARDQRIGLWSPSTCNGNPDLPASGT